MRRKPLTVSDSDQVARTAASTSILRTARKRLMTLERRLAASVVFAIAVLLYLLSAPPLLPHHIDPLTNTLTAWNLANEGTFYLDRWESVTGEDFYAQSNQIVTGRDRPISKYPPGAAILAAPIYAIFDDLDSVVVNYPTGSGDTASTKMDLPGLWPSAVVGALTTAGAVALLFSTFDRLVTRDAALIAAGAVGLGTSLWTIASQALWQHGPAALTIATGLWALSQDRLWLAGFAISPLLLIRPQAAIAIAVLGIFLSALRRSLMPAIALGLPATIGAALYLGFNVVAFGERLPTAAGGYAASIDGPSSRRFEALYRAFVDRYRGVFVYSPFTALAVPGLLGRRRAVPDWAWASLAGAAVLFLFQIRAGDFSGGVGFFGYRYPIEPLVFASPALLAAAVAWIGDSVWKKRLAFALVGLGVAVHAVGAFT